MRIKLGFILCVILLFLFFLFYNIGHKKSLEANVLLLPSLPRPIASEYALITTAGQCTEAYIVNDVANKLMIHNYFMPQATASDLEGVKTLVLIVGYSPLGEKLNGVSFQEEKLRIEGLLQRAKEKKLVVLTLYISGKDRRDKQTDELLNSICPSTNYLIVTSDSNGDDFFSKLAKKSSVPLTLINGVNNISEPFASAFR